MVVLGAFRGNVRDDLSWLNSAGRPDPTQTFYRANLPRLPLDDVPALTSGVMTLVPVYLYEGDLVTNLTFISGSTAVVTPANQWTALYSPAGALLAQSADKTNAAWAADTAVSFALATPYRATKPGMYWVGINVTAATVPTLVGTQAARPVLTGEINLAQTSGSGLAGVAPATIAAPAWRRQVPLVVVN
ncbi:hypothetical protein [Kitasatospora sp. McL0602]|uniref:hypothetical protein n=1 Tax=Kitasatospora sp. McL0602 TaxID=3439530 RepID=UPI003F89B0AA